MEDKITNQENLIDGYAEKFARSGFTDPPNFLFHYTSSDTLLKIVQGKSIWMSHALCMNDSSEFSHGMTKFKKALDLLEGGGVETAWLNRIREFFDREMKNPHGAPYVFSLTEEPDQLSQWRGYGDSGCGVSIGLQSGAFVSLPDLHFRPMPVIYDEEEQDSIVQSVVTGFFDLIRLMDSKVLDDGKTWGPKLALGYFIPSYVHSARFKHKSWSEEREWRAVVMAKDGNPKVHLRTKGKSLVRYFDLPLPVLKALLAKIVIGPASDKKLQRLALDALKVKEGLAFEVLESAIPMKA